jgi:mycothiol synthase
MIRWNLRNLPDLHIPAGYALRNIAPGDLHVWTALLHENHGFGDWPVERSLPLFGSATDVVFDGSYVLAKDGEPVASALLHHQTKRPDAPLAQLGWVAVAPRYQGQGLAYVVCLAVLRTAAALGDTALFLGTEDYRLPAIYTYLKLGFEPWLYDWRTVERWEGILASLGWQT